MTIKVHELYNDREVKKRYFRSVDEYIKLNAAIDCMRVGAEVYANRYPHDQGIAYGTMTSIKYVLDILEQKMGEVKRFRERAGFDPLPDDFPEATAQLMHDHYGVTPKDDDPKDTE